MPTCPRCADTALAPHSVHGVDLEMCPGCEGVLVPQSRLVALLDAMMTEWGDEIDADMHIEAVPPGEAGASCPHCSQSMTAFGYMGTRLVELDRCGRCQLLWTDPEELATVGLLYARTQLRSSRRRQAREDAERERNQRFDVMMQRQRMRGFLGLRSEMLGSVAELALGGESKS